LAILKTRFASLRRGSDASKEFAGKQRYRKNPAARPSS